MQQVEAPAGAAIHPQDLISDHSQGALTPVFGL
jgi:hypothetical protein